MRYIWSVIYLKPLNMKKVLLPLLLVFAASHLCFAHDSSDKGKEKVYTEVDFPAQFRESSLATWLINNIRYSKEMRDNNLSGQVFIECIIGENGKISSPRIISSPHEALSEEAFRLIKTMPKWSPAKLDGKDVASLHQFYIRFHPYKPVYVIKGEPKSVDKASSCDMADKRLTRMPQFSEGNPQLWIARNVHYPADAIKQGIEGKVYVSFVIDKDGSICDVAIVKGVHPLLDRAAYRVVCGMPKWFPRMLGDKIVKVRHTMPINFKMSAHHQRPVHVPIVGPKYPFPR